MLALLGTGCSAAAKAYQYGLHGSPNNIFQPSNYQARSATYGLGHVRLDGRCEIWKYQYDLYVRYNTDTCGFATRVKKRLHKDFTSESRLAISRFVCNDLLSSASYQRFYFSNRSGALSTVPKLSPKCVAAALSAGWSLLDSFTRTSSIIGCTFKPLLPAPTYLVTPYSAR